MTSSPWNAPEAEPTPPATLAPPGPASLADPMQVARDTWADFTAHPVGYVTAGIAYFVAVFGLVLVALGALGLGMAPGLATEDETVLVIGGILGFTVYFVLIMAFSMLGFPLMTASLLRNFDAQRRGGPAAGLTAAFDAMRPRMGKIVQFYLLNQLAVLVGVMFFYVPGLIAAALGLFALPIVVFEEVGPLEAHQRGWDHMRKFGTWHLSIWLLLLVGLIACELTIVGVVLLWPLLVGYQLSAYRLAFGATDPTPAVT